MDFKELYRETFAQVRSSAAIDVRAIKSAGRRVRYRKALLIAAVVCALMALCITAYSKDFLGLQSFILGSDEPQSVSEGTEEDAHSGEAGYDRISLLGYADSPESRAVAEWLEFVDSYDADGSILASIGNGPTGVDQKYSLYNAYTQEMADKLQEIVDKYGLYLHSRCEVVPYGELVQLIGGGFLRGESISSDGDGYIYEDGSFLMPLVYTDMGMTISSQLIRNVKGSFTDTYLNIGDASEYMTVEYTCGDRQLLLAKRREKALMITQSDDASITLNVLLKEGQDVEFSTLEKVAKLIDWEMLADVETPDLTTEAEKPARHWESFAQVLDEAENDAAPGEMLMYSLYDIDGGGTEEMVLHTGGGDGGQPVYSVYMQDNGQVTRAEYQIYAEAASLWQAEGGFYCVYRDVTYKYELRDGELAAHVEYRSGDGAAVVLPSDEPFLWSMSDRRGLLSGDTSDTFTYIQDFVIYAPPLGARGVYAAALKNILNFNIMPDGEDISGLLSPSADMSNVEFAVFDVDGDGAEELIILQPEGPTAVNKMYIFGYDEDRGATKLEFSEYMNCEFFDNGIIKAYASHNQGWGGRFWPYTVYEYDPVEDAYIEKGRVDAWDSQLSEDNPDLLPPFPKEQDTSGSGFLYYIYDNGYDSQKLYDRSVYLQWIDKYIGGAQVIDIPFVPLTDENISGIAS